MQFITGCGENTPGMCSKNSATRSDDWDKLLPTTVSKPCPINNLTFFGTRKQIIRQDNTVKCYFVDFDNGHKAKPRIYLLDDRARMDQVHHWLERNGKKLEEKSNVANIPQMFPWHNELLQYAKNGEAVSYIADYAEPDEYKKLVTIFRDYGRQVDTVPGRKPPLLKGPDGQFPIEWIDDKVK